MWELWSVVWNILKEEDVLFTAAEREDRAKRYFIAIVAFAHRVESVTNGRHKSYYLHLFVWLVPRQTARFGNLWRFCTSAAEYRNARFKRMKVSWRPDLGKEVWGKYRKKIGDEVVEFKRRYNSSPMLQLLRNVSCVEHVHSNKDSVSSFSV